MQLQQEMILCKTKNLLVRRMLPSDTEDLYLLLSDERVMEYLEPLYSRKAAEAFLEKAGLSDPPLIYAVCDRSEKFIGYVVFHRSDEHGAEIGWVLSPAAWRKGYASELTAALLQTATSAHEYAIIECSPKHEATKRIALKNGFAYCGMTDGCEVYKYVFNK